MWLYTPVSVRLVQPSSSQTLHCLSGIYLIDDSLKSKPVCLTICPVSATIVESYDVLVAAPHLSHGDVVWYNTTVTETAAVFAEGGSLSLYVATALAHGFKFFPSDAIDRTLHRDLHIMVLELRSIVTLDKLDSFESATADAPCAMTVRSCPFGFTNSKLFADFKAAGSIALRVGSAELCSGYLSDVRYLENMIGGIVMAKNASLGLVAGNLRKLNGDGDLVVVLSWDAIFRALPSFFATRNSQVLMHQSLALSNISQTSPLECVLPLTFSKNGTFFSWGSSILLRRDTIVTNFHVMKPFLASEDVTCHVVLPNGKLMTLSSSDEIIVPFPELDLAFVCLAKTNQLKLSGVTPAKMCFSSRVEPSDQVFTAGFGLMLSEQNLRPLVSEGRVCLTFSAIPTPVSKAIPCMLITSGSCWNGSSGGGVFTKSGAFFGLISSNAEVWVPAVAGSGPVPAKTEKNSQFCFCIPLELIMECYRLKVVDRTESAVLSNHIAKTWRLEATYDDVLERRTKL